MAKRGGNSRPGECLYEADIGWSDMGQLSALHDWSALPDWLDDKHVELLPVTEEGDDCETGSLSLVTTVPSASPSSALSTLEVLPATIDLFENGGLPCLQE